MSIEYSKEAKNELLNIRNFIAQSSSFNPVEYTQELVKRINGMLEFPYIGKVNRTFNRKDIRDLFIDGYKIIYKIQTDVIIVLILYKYIQFNEKQLNVNPV
jgi:toxin ParE1/3/4